MNGGAETIRVMARIRPLNDRESSLSESLTIHGATLFLESKNAQYGFDHVFGYAMLSFVATGTITLSILHLAPRINRIQCFRRLYR